MRRASARGALFRFLVSHLLEPLAFDLGELDAAGGVGDVDRSARCRPRAAAPGTRARRHGRRGRCRNASPTAARRVPWPARARARSLSRRRASHAVRGSAARVWRRPEVVLIEAARAFLVGGRDREMVHRSRARTRVMYEPYRAAVTPNVDEGDIDQRVAFVHWGTKTDVKDSEWICQLVGHGLARPSFVSPREIRRLRDLTRLRKAQINERGSSSCCARSRAPGSRCAGADRRIRPRHGSLPDRQALRLIGRSTSRPSRISWPPALRSNPAQAPLADRARQGRRPTKGTDFAADFPQLRGRLRRAQSDRRHPARNPGRLLRHRPRPGPIPRARPRLAAQALLRRTPRAPTPTPTPSARVHRHAATRRRVRADRLSPQTRCYSARIRRRTTGPQT